MYATVTFKAAPDRSHRRTTNQHRKEENKMLFTKLVKELVERLSTAEARAEELEKKVKRLEEQRENDSWNVQKVMGEHSRITSEISGLKKDVRQLWGKSPDEKSVWNKE